ncbi:polyprenol monophosphomannose synthase [Sphingomonas naphthae]|uniref:Polyprenol monophosphomannose synthase n=1 Tax=Sphingomonas naphthae TaxID=1813468 RepID=A0ABY7THK8_9SPHN|nr:polyprenol monophosphomannose synthase [Sphingomonas naphthae]WCT72707.1 polyprenol monophosphomannose synthase [Sphingomonas naphthae]
MLDRANWSSTAAYDIREMFRPAPRAAELTIVVPSYNERENIDELVSRVGEALVGIDWEMIVVDDDSPDGTADHVRSIGRRDGRVRVIRRVGRRGLSSACIEGMLASSAPVLAVMDADLQHDPAVLPSMLSLVREDRAELVVASRHVAGGSIGEWGAGRALVSRVASGLCRSRATKGLSDPMSGFFMLRRRVLDDTVPHLSGKGFKILLDIVLTSARPLRIREVPLVFAMRKHGASKLGAGVVFDYLSLLAEKKFGRLNPIRLIAPAGAVAAGLGVAWGTSAVGGAAAPAAVAAGMVAALLCQRRSIARQ